MKWVIGIDEVGRGPIAGPVAVCACAIPRVFYRKTKWIGLTDSKKMTQKAREIWFKEAVVLKKTGKINFSVVYRSNGVIDKKGIAPSIRECIAQALKNLALAPRDCEVLLDGSLSAPREYLNQKTIIKGDLKEKSISLASVIAKVSRDKRLVALHAQYPLYQWEKNKGYGTRAHYHAIQQHGITPLHRKTFLSSIKRQPKAR